jgi:Rrf2 family transcriptional regulator, nitric oxide-sensitive transcriptional repressor
MQLTRFSDLSLRLLMYLASREEPLDATVTVRAASTLFNVPYTHMVKVAHQLGKHGLLTTAKGKGGGLRLSRPPEHIRVGEVLRFTESDHGVIDCFTQPCPLRSHCLLKNALDEAYQAFFTSLDRYSLADVAETPALKTLVQIAELPLASPRPQ